MNALINLEFPVAGSFLPADHGYHLYAAISRFFDTPRGGNWFHEAADLALLPVNGTYVPERRLRLDHSARFLLRLDSASIPRALPLAGKRLEVAGEPLRVGAPRVTPLIPSVALRARIVTTKNGDEEERFDAEVHRQLEELGIQGAAQRGRRRIITIRSKKVVGHELTITKLSAEESIALQTHGVGGRRKMGCGVFVPVRV